MDCGERRLCRGGLRLCNNIHSPNVEAASDIHMMSGSFERWTFSKLISQLPGKTSQAEAMLDFCNMPFVLLLSKFPRSISLYISYDGGSSSFLHGSRFDAEI